MSTVIEQIKNRFKASNIEFTESSNGKEFVISCVTTVFISFTKEQVNKVVMEGSSDSFCSACTFGLKACMTKLASVVRREKRRVEKLFDIEGRSIKSVKRLTTREYNELETK